MINHYLYINLFQIKSTSGGIGLILLGLLILYFTFKFPQKDKYSPLTENVKGLIAAFGFIIIGILFLIGYFDKFK
jgi:hypothetical protein